MGDTSTSARGWRPHLKAPEHELRIVAGDLLSEVPHAAQCRIRRVVAGGYGRRRVVPRKPVVRARKGLTHDERASADVAPRGLERPACVAAAVAHRAASRRLRRQPLVEAQHARVHDGPLAIGVGRVRVVLCTTGTAAECSVVTIPARLAPSPLGKSLPGGTCRHAASRSLLPWSPRQE